MKAIARRFSKRYMRQVNNLTLWFMHTADGKPLSLEAQEAQELLESKDDRATANEKKVIVDGEEIEIVGKEKVTFKCGLSSITLTSDGKIMIRGKYILNRSTGVNRIMGGSVQMN